MGTINFGVPQREVDFLQQQMKLDVFVEGGTFSGGTARKMSRSFRQVYTIENSDHMYDIARANISEKNVALLKGDTREHLPGILSENDNVLFWLDAHWSGGETYGKDDECPLLEELDIIFQHDKNTVILIDDARLFLAPPPHPHDRKSWPSLAEISRFIPESWDLIVFQDVIYLFPKTQTAAIAQHFQERVTAQWQAMQKAESNPLKKLFNRVTRTLAGSD